MTVPVWAGVLAICGVVAGVGVIIYLIAKSVNGL